MRYVLTALMLAVMAVPALAVPLSGGAVSRSIVVGTLADANNPVEMATAPEYTRLAVLRQRTASLLSGLAADPVVTPIQLRSALIFGASIQANADAARKLLDDTNGTKVLTPRISEAIAQAREGITRAEITYDNLRGILK